MPFYSQDQNNSGGTFYNNDDVAHYVIVEADNVKEAIAKFDEIFEDYSSFCECCGERWGHWWLIESDGSSVPEIRKKPIESFYPTYSKNMDAIIYYKDGKRLRYKFLTRQYEVIKMAEVQLTVETMIENFEKELTVELFKEFLADESINGEYKQNYLHHIAYHLRGVAKEKYGYDTEVIDAQLAGEYVSETLKTVLKFGVDNGLYEVEEEV